jgi:NAD-dependent dihydropyrimidine dehydrogenase PreA subunit
VKDERDVDDEILIDIEGKLVGLAGLGTLFDEFTHRDLSDIAAVKAELLERVGGRNYIPPGRHELYGEAIFRELTRHLERDKGGEGKKRTAMTWRGIPRKTIQWYPTVDEDACDGCKKCVTFCAFGVFTYSGSQKSVSVTDPFACVVGCSLCASICGAKAISFPPLSYLDDLPRARG